MWRTLPWGVTHHGAYEHLNGALLAGYHLRGDVVFRRNKIENAYNGIRLTARECSKSVRDGRGDKICDRYNHSIWIYENLFSYIRDNPIELEDWATEAHISKNTFRNAHAWLSFDGTGGGPVFIYGNIGWFDDMPALHWPALADEATCLRTPDIMRVGVGVFDSRYDRRFDHGSGWWNAVGVNEHVNGRTEWMDPAEMECGRSTTGRVLKIGMPDAGSKAEAFDRYLFFTRAPLYLFNNSWFVRAPVTGSGWGKNLRHWNNAILFCEPGVPGYDAVLCRTPPDPAASESSCGTAGGRGLERWLGPRGAIPFFDCFRWYPIDSRGVEMRDRPHVFDHDVSSNGFPAALTSIHGMETNGRQADPGFEAAQSGDFRLRQDAAARTSRCRVEVVDASGALACGSTSGSGAFAGAFAPVGTPYGGADGQRFKPPR